VLALGALDAEYLLYAAPEFPDEHARLVTDAMDHAGLVDPPPDALMHAGAAAYWD
jgi:hypothetical protein